MSTKGQQDAKTQPGPVPSEGLFPVVCLGASAGGLEPLTEFFDHVPPGSGNAYVVVTHLPKEQRSILPELLSKHTAMPLTAVTGPVVVEPDTVYVIPPEHDLEMVGPELHLVPREPHGIRTPIDHFLTSLARERHDRAVAIILSGGGRDGSHGVRAIKSELGMVMVQDPQQAQHNDMPTNALATGLVDYVLPVEAMPRQLQHYLRAHSFGRHPVTAKPGTDEALQKIHALLHQYSGQDFSKYKATTVMRRIHRRMAVHQLDDIGQYAQFLQTTPSEGGHLFRELLVGVTNFFRDPEGFDALSNRVLPELLDEVPDGHTVRIWTPGASTGEEAYSIAILVRECLEKKGRIRPVQIFATDLNEEAVEVARHGTYPGTIENDMSSERLQANFTKDDGHYRIRREVREMLVFSRQNLLTDPPFTRLDLICCRNLLIYLDPDLQQQVLPLFHYALRPDGVLFLGSSETIGEFGHLFEVIDKKWKIFRRKPVAPTHPAMLRMPLRTSVPAPKPPRRAPESDHGDGTLVRLVEKSLLEQFAPASVIVDADGSVIYVHGHTGDYLELASGQARMNILEMAREGLKERLPNLLQSAMNRHSPVRLDAITLHNEGETHRVTVTVQPFQQYPKLAGCFAILFQPIPETPAQGEPSAEVASPAILRNLEQELAAMRENLQTTIEELETSNEELRSLNEEYQSTNEELQSANEELQTSREEMQSLNEELATVNDQLNDKVVSLTEMHGNLENFLNGLDIPTIFLDRELRVQRFTQRATTLVNLIGNDVGRPLAHLTTNLADDSLLELAQDVLKTLQRCQKIVADNEGRRYLLRILPYRAGDDKVEGVVMTFVDVEELEQARADLAESETARDFAQSIVDTVRHPLLVLDADLRLLHANPMFYRTFGLTPEASTGKLIYELADGAWAGAELRRLLEQVLPAEKQIEDFPIDLKLGRDGTQPFLLNAQAVYEFGERTRRILLALERARKTNRAKS